MKKEKENNFKIKEEDILQKLDKYRNIEFLEEYFYIESSKDLVNLVKQVNSLVDEGKIHENDKFEYIRADLVGYFQGTISIRNNTAFLLQEDRDDFFVDLNHPHTADIALNGDTVQVKAISDATATLRAESYIVKVVKRKEVVGVVKRGRKGLYLKTLSDNIDLVDGNKDMLNCTYSAIPFTRKKRGENRLYAKLDKLIANKNDLDKDVKRFIYAYDIEDEFNPKVLKEANALTKFDDIDKRIDLRNDMTITIDSLSAKDLDDAVYIEKQGDKYLLRVSIADVSYYVRENTELDKTAYERSTSAYLTDRVIPMLPERLSNDLCSLNENTDKATLTCEMIIDNHGTVVNHKIYPSVINTHKRMSYEFINKYYGGTHNYDKPLEDMLNQMKNLQAILYKKRHDRGSFNFESTELNIALDDKYEVTSVSIRERGISERVIEEFMILANETVAEHFFNAKLPFIYRIHETPNYDKIQDIVILAKHKGFDFKGDMKDQKLLQELVDKLQESDDSYIANEMLLRTMAKAIYSSNHLPHYGLASEYYCHFTSPIRRYPDLMVHRLIRNLVAEEFTDKTFNHFDSVVSGIAEHASKKERAAVQVERDVDKFFICKYMEHMRGRNFDGKITSVMKFGLYVELDNGIEGLVHVRNMRGYFDYNDDNSTLSDGKTTYSIGDEIKISVLSSNKDDLTIDFVLR